MSDDQLFRWILVTGAVAVLPWAFYFRLKSQATREPLDRTQEGAFILLTLRPIGIAGMVGLIAYMVNPASMAWSSMPVPSWLRWFGVGLGACGGGLLIWAMASLGPNLTDTVVTRKRHELVTRGPYRWVRHPFYDAMVLAVVANALVAANWFLLATGVLSFGLILLRTPREEERLADRFGDQYEAWTARTGRFVPRIGQG